MIKLRTLALEALNKKDPTHYVLTTRMSEEKAMKKYISKNFFDWIQEPSQDQTIESGKTYIVVQNEQEVGAFGTKELKNDRVLELWYVLKENYRGQKIGEKLLGEVTPYLIEHLNIDDIRLVINKENVASMKIAKENGYLEEAIEHDLVSFRYFGDKKGLNK